MAPRDPRRAPPAREDRRSEVLRLAREVVEAAGAELVDVEVHGSARRPLLRVFVDVPGGTTAEACAVLSRAIEERVERDALLGERYVLEVSSPGLDRPLRTRRDFERLRGRSVALRLVPAEGRQREVVGTLEEVGETEGAGFWVHVRPAHGGEPLRLAAADVESARAHIPW